MMTQPIQFNFSLFINYLCLFSTIRPSHRPKTNTGACRLHKDPMKGAHPHVQPKPVQLLASWIQLQLALTSCALLSTTWLYLQLSNGVASQHVQFSGSHTSNQLICLTQPPHLESHSIHFVFLQQLLHSSCARSGVSHGSSVAQDEIGTRNTTGQWLRVSTSPRSTHNFPLSGSSLISGMTGRGTACPPGNMGSLATTAVGS